MSTPEPIVENIDTNDDLDAFNELLYSKEPVAKDEPKDDGPKDNDDEVDEDNAPIEQEETQTNEDDDLADQDEAPKPKPKTRAEKRIEQLLEEARIQRERADRAEARLNEKKEPEANKPAPVAKIDASAPHPDDKNEDGTDKYPLGLFDEAYQEDRFNYKMEKSLAEQRAALEQQKQEAEAQRAQEALTNTWNEKLEPARERYPDFQEKGEELLETFAGLDKQYGEYLTTTIMSMDQGPDVLYFLSNNIDEAERIVSLGPLGATIALGRIEAGFLNDVEEKPKPRPKVSKAPVPPPTNRGSSAALPEVPDDTDDLDAFSAKLFKKG